MALIKKGSFTADGEEKILVLPSSVDTLVIENITEMAAQSSDHGYRYKWHRGLADGYGIVEYHTGATHEQAIDILTSGGFTAFDTSEDPLGAVNATLTNVSAAAIPIVSAGSTTGVADGSVVKLYNIVGGQQLNGIEFTVDTVVTDTSFRLPYMAQIVAATTGSFRVVKYPPLFYPRVRTISKVTQAVNAVVTMTVAHGYTEGMKIKFRVPDDFGMTELDGLVGTVTAVGAGTITVDIDSRTFTAFAFPLTAAAIFTPAQTIAIGKAKNETYLDSVVAPIENVSYIGIKLTGGNKNPGGSNNDEIYWEAYKADETLVE